MTLPRLLGHLRASRWRATRKAVSVAGVLIAIATLLSGVARASCLDLAEPSVRPLQELGIRDPKKALETVKLALAAAERSATKNQARIAALYAVEAESYSLLELDADARSAALKGLESAPDENDPTHLTLLMLEAENIYAAGGLDSARVTLEKAQSRQAAGSRAVLCLQIALGQLQNRSGRSDLAILTLTRAYRASLALAATEPRVLAAAALSPVMRAVGDFKQALALNQEEIDWDLRHHARLSLSVARYLRGQILSEMHDYSAAVEEIEQARQLSVELSDEQGVAFAELATCRVRLELEQLAPARTGCENALRIFAASRSIDMEKESQTLLARLDLAEGHADKAIARLNEVLSRGGEDMQPRQVPPVYEVRARANEIGRAHV